MLLEISLEGGLGVSLARRSLASGHWAVGHRNPSAECNVVLVVAFSSDGVELDARWRNMVFRTLGLRPAVELIVGEEFRQGRLCFLGLAVWVRCSLFSPL